MRTFGTDLKLDEIGNVQILGSLQAVLAACETALRAQRGEMQYATDEGLPTRELAWDDYLPAQFAAAGRSVLLKIPNVLSVESFDVSRTSEILSYNARIRTAFGTGVIRG